MKSLIAAGLVLLAAAGSVPTYQATISWAERETMRAEAAEVARFVQQDFMLTGDLDVSVRAGFEAWGGLEWDGEPNLGERLLKGDVLLYESADTCLRTEFKVTAPRTVVYRVLDVECGAVAS